MAPIKFEEKIKDTLEQRTIEPSAGSWSKLSDRLDKDASQKSPRFFWWIGIAASIVLMLSIAIQFFGDAPNEELMPQVVEEQLMDKNMDIVFPDIIEENEVVVTEKSEDEVITEQKNSAKAKTNVKKPVSKNNYTKDNTKVASVENATEDRFNADNDVLEENTPVINETSISKEAVAVILEDLNSTNKENSIEREVDSLLKLASKELFRNKLKEESTKTVDAKALLESVQDDMGQSFRTRVFEALKDSYNTVKTAVAERNN